MQTLSFEQIANHINRTGYPCWMLSVVRNFQKNAIMNYWGEDFAENDTQEQRCEKSIKHLQSLIADFPQDTVFTIELKSNPKSATVYGPFSFSLNEPAQPQPQPQQPAFNGFGAPPPGFVSEAYLNGKLAEERAESKKQLQEALFEMRERELKERYDRKAQELADKERELKDEEKKYNSGTGQAADALYLAIKKIIMGFMPTGASAAQPQPETLGAPTAQPQPAEEITNPEKAAAVNKLANLLYENPKLDVKNIELLTQTINDKLNGNGFYQNNSSNAEKSQFDGAGAGLDDED